MTPGTLKDGAANAQSKALYRREHCNGMSLVVVNLMQVKRQAIEILSNDDVLLAHLKRLSARMPTVLIFTEQHASWRTVVAHFRDMMSH